MRAIKDEIVPTAKRNGCVIRPWNNSFIEKSEAVTKDLKEQYEKRIQSEKEYQEEWRERYTAHLRSDKWRDIRNLVFERDRGVCQGYLQERATHVHHRTYEHMGDELMYELISLCRNCHDKVHDGKLSRNYYESF